MRRTPTILLVSAALALSACGGGEQVDLEPVNSAIEALDNAQGDLRSRMSDIETSLTALGAADGSDDALAASGLLEQLAELESAVEQLRTDLAQQGMDAETARGELSALVASLEATINGVTTTLSTLRNDIARLREDHDVLKQRFERHLQDHNG